MLWHLVTDVLNTLLVGRGYQVGSQAEYAAQLAGNSVVWVLRPNLIALKTSNPENLQTARSLSDSDGFTLGSHLLAMNVA